MLYSILNKTLLILLLLLIRTEAFADNQITIEQVSSGNSNDIDVNVEGTGNEVNFSYGGAVNKVNIDSVGKGNWIGYTSVWGSGASWGGDLYGSNNNLDIRQSCSEGSNCNGNTFGFHISGNSNNISVGQGWDVDASGSFSADLDEYGGHSALLDVHGSNNTIALSQRNDNANGTNSANMYVYGDYNDIHVRQKQAAQTLNLTVNNDYNDVSIQQRNNGQHNANITLSGDYGTTLSLIQQGGTNQSYSLSQNCLTSGGCSVSVTQGQ